MKVKIGFLVSTTARFAGGTYDAEKNFREAVVAFLKKQGDKVEKDDFIVEVATDKVTVELSLGDLGGVDGGTIIELNYGNGDKWEYGGTRDLANGDKMFLPELGEIETGHEEAPVRELARVRAAPAARKMAREAGIDIETIQGTGPNDRVMRTDVEQAIAGRDKTKREPKPEMQPKPLDDVVLLVPDRERLALAHALEKGSGTTIAGGQPTSLDPEYEEYDFSELLKFKQDHGNDFTKTFGVRFRIWAPLTLAVARVLAIERFMIFNGFWHIEDEIDRSKDKVALYKSVHLGLAYDRKKWPLIDWEKRTIFGQGLRILTLHNTDELETKEFFVKLDDLLTRADYDTENAGGKLSRTTLRDWTGHSFIFNNVGAARHKRGNSLLTPKMSAMLNMGALSREGTAILEVFFDHRMIDGGITTDFLDAVYEELLKKILPYIKLKCAENS